MAGWRTSCSVSLQPAPTAPYAYAQLAGAAAPGFVWHADPVHMEAARDHLIVQSLGTDAPTAEGIERADRCRQRARAEHGLSVHRRAGSVGSCYPSMTGRSTRVRWRRSTETAVEMPGGRDAQIWNRLHNEIQMAWHAHEVNAQREAERDANDQCHLAARRRAMEAVASDRIHAGALGCSGVTRRSTSRRCAVPRRQARQRPTRRSWSSMTHGYARQRQDWGAWLQAITEVDRSLVEHSEDSIDLIFCGNTLRTFELRPSDRYKPWRRRTLAQAFTE